MVRHAGAQVLLSADVLSMHAAVRQWGCAGSYCIAPVVERASGARHLQLLSGCPMAAYWLGHYLWDLLIHTGVCCASLAIFWIYGNAATTGSLQQAGGTFLLLWLYGAAVVPLVYLYSFGFATPSACQVRLPGHAGRCRRSPCCRCPRLRRPLARAGGSLSSAKGCGHPAGQ